MTITTEPIPGLTIDELNHLTSSIGDDIINWGTSSSTYGAVPNVTVNNNGLYSTITSAPTTFGHVCAVTIDGAIWCWGGNDKGQAKSLGL